MSDAEVRDLERRLAAARARAGLDTADALVPRLCALARKIARARRSQTQDTPGIAQVMRRRWRILYREWLRRSGRRAERDAWTRSTTAPRAIDMRPLTARLKYGDLDRWRAARDVELLENRQFWERTRKRASALVRATIAQEARLAEFEALAATPRDTARCGCGHLASEHGAMLGCAVRVGTGGMVCPCDGFWTSETAARRLAEVCRCGHRRRAHGQPHAGGLCRECPYLAEGPVCRFFVRVTRGDGRHPCPSCVPTIVPPLERPTLTCNRAPETHDAVNGT